MFTEGRLIGESWLFWEREEKTKLWQNICDSLCVKNMKTIMEECSDDSELQ